MTFKETGPTTTYGNSPYTQPNRCTGTPCTQTTYTGPSNIVSHYYKATRGAEIPGFHRLRRQGVLIPHTAFSQFETETDGGSFDMTITNSACTCNPRFDQHGPWGHFTISEEEMVPPTELLGSSANAMNELAARILGNGFDVATWAAEFPKSLELFSGVGKRLLRLMKGRPQALAGKGWEDPWLEWRYGWRLLYYDALNFRKTWNYAASKKKRVGARLTYGGGSSVITDHHLSPDTWGVGYEDTTTEWNVSQRASLLADFRPRVIRINPVLTAWELIPHSFIADWFLPIGNYISALEFLTYNASHTGSVGLKVEKTITKIAGISSFKTGYGGSRSGHTSAHATLEVRTPASPGSFPDLQVNLDVHKVRDIFALVRKAFLQR